MKSQLHRPAPHGNAYGNHSIRLAIVGFAIILAASAAVAQTTPPETTWGGAGSDVADGVATATDGSSYVVGITDSFATDQFGNPAARIFLVKFGPTGLLVWQRIWN